MVITIGIGMKVKQSRLREWLAGSQRSSIVMADESQRSQFNDLAYVNYPGARASGFFHPRGKHLLHND